ncbi:helix-turn-helix domain-containing protein [Sediminicola luteus]|uniref:Transcriptional regulator n=1 Tax=Sediminicola luteus TaxID=319238 RepID=A0A2A4GG32_9FLAO|nr:helix-turn-helix transcriptional regulator [Sediminicola luteus]PCE66735.1 transcriptional regulator [Sediminicola luteus]
MTKDDLKKRIGKKIVELRLQKGWNQAKLAKESGKDRQAIEKIENGKVNPTIYTLYELSLALKVPLDYLVKIH